MSDFEKAKDLFVRSLALIDGRNFIEAQILLREASRLVPDRYSIVANLALTQLELRQTGEARQTSARMIALDPQNPAGWNSLGTACGLEGSFEEALVHLDKAIVLQPEYADAHFLRGHALKSLQRPEEALASLDRAIALTPDYAEAHNSRGVTLADLDRPDEAVASYDQAIAFKRDYAEAYSNRGNALADLERFDDAVAGHDRAIALKPDYAEAHNNRGTALQHLKRPEEALAAYDRAIALKPDYAEAHSNRGNALLALHFLEDALASHDRAIALKPDYAEAYSNRANVLVQLQRSQEALANFGQAIRLKPEYAEAHACMGHAFTELRRHAEAIAAFDRALAIKPDLAEVEGARLHNRMQLCSWDNLPSEIDHLMELIGNNLTTTAPFPLLAIGSSAEQQLDNAKFWTRKNLPSSSKPFRKTGFPDHPKIRLGYMSADLRQHPVAYLIAGVFERHDRSRFETTAISIGVNDGSEIRRRLEQSFDTFIEARAVGSDDLAKKIAEAEIDILIDLTGLTLGARTEVFTRRPAPVQVNYLGFPGTMGTDCYDYILADPTLIPADQRNCFSEKVAYLPNTYMPHDDRNRMIADRAFERSEFGLPEHGFVFCCFNNAYKLNPEVFRTWMRLLKAVPGSVLWLGENAAAANDNLRKEAFALGIDPERIIFARRIASSADHLARHGLADLFLDTLPYNAHTTASDALWAGLPVLTQIGKTFAGRVAASLLNAIDLPELIAETPAECERMAIELAQHPEKLAAIRQKLAANRGTSPLFDTALFTRHLEAAYIAMYERHQAGLAPDHIFIPH